MRLPEIICAVIVSGVGVFLTIAGYILERQKYWLKRGEVIESL